jgi:hypothetical protein
VCSKATIPSYMVIERSVITAMARRPTQSRKSKILIVLLSWTALASLYAAQGQVCTISEGRTAKAQAVFAKIANVFRQPRCANCHGGVNPFTPNTQHAGGTFDIVKTDDGYPSFATFEPCQSCHGAVKNWQTPDEDQSFVGKDDVTLCKQIKFNLLNGEDVIDHFTRDRGGPPFIEVAFQGTRGLNAEGKSLVDQYRPQPIEGVTQGQLIGWAREWLSDLDSLLGLIAGSRDTDCGCAQHHYALQVHDHMTINSGAIHFEAGFASDPVVRLVFDDHGKFHSETATTRDAGAGSGGPCTMQGGAEVTVSAKGQLVDKSALNSASGIWETTPDGNMKVEITVAFPGSSGSLQCPQASFSATGTGGASSLNFELDSVVGAKSPEIPAVPSGSGAEGSIWVKLIQVD